MTPLEQAKHQGLLEGQRRMRDMIASRLRDAGLDQPASVVEAVDTTSPIQVIEDQHG